MAAKLNGFSIDLEKYITPNHNPFYINDESYRNLIYQHKKRKLENPDDSELNTKGITISDIVHRTQLPYNKNLPIISKHQLENKVVNRKKVKKEHVIYRRSPEIHFNNKLNAAYEHSSNSDSDSDSIIDAVSVNSKSKHKISKQRLSRTPTPKNKIEIKKEPLTPEFKSSNIANCTNANTVKSNIMKPVNSITQYGKITPVRVEDLDGIDVMSIPIDLDNSDIDILELSNKPELMQETHANFFSLIRDVICSTNEHRMNMYTLQERLKSWQENPISPLNDWYSYTDNWIGILPSAITFLCGNASEQPDDFVPYMEYKVTLDVYQWIGAGRDSDNLLSALCNFWLEHRTENKHLSPSKDGELDLDIIDRANTPPPPRFPTSWTVRKATPEEIKDFREQERRRYDNPHKAFTYRCNNYESVVGPLKGIYNPAVGNTKARGHTMLSADRPNFVTILSLVRDAAARLPNGEGTRAEICELLKSSQYISSTALDNILQSVVSGMNKSKKTSTKKSPAKPKTKQVGDKTIKINKTESIQPTQTASQQELTTKVVRRPSLQQQSSKPAALIPATQSTPIPNLVSVSSQQKSTSLLLSNNLNLSKQQSVEISQSQSQKQSSEDHLAASMSDSGVKQSKEDKEINEALQAIVQNRVSSPTIKTGKSLVKILSPTQGKSLIIPTTNPQLIKQIQEQRSTPTKQLNQVVTQQLLQTIAAQQKQILVQKQNIETADSRTEKIKVPASVQQQIIQSITPQQLQNIKNVTLLRAQPNQNVNLTPVATISSQSSSEQNNVVTVAVTKQDQIVGQQGVQIKTHGNLTPAQQQQILQTIKQKILPNAGLLTNQQQQIILKQKSGVMQVQKQNAIGSTTQIIGQQKISADNSVKPVSTPQGPVVAKVLTNAAGQVISVESLLAHQKQHGSLPQGTTLRVSGTKGGPQNIIHLTGTTKQNSITQFAVGSQNNILAITSQPKLVVASQPSTVTSSVTTTKPTSRTLNKAQTLSKFSSKGTQQLINAKIVTQGLDGQKIVQPKLVVGQNQVKLSSGKSIPLTKPVTLNMAGNANTIRMVNAANLNLTHIAGKPVLLASKGGTIQNLQGQNVILQTQPNASGASLVLQNTVKSSTSNLQQTNANSINILNQSNIVFSPQVKVQQPQQVVFSTNAKTGQVGTQQTITQGHIMLGGHPVRLQTSNATSTQRVVLASQGQGGQIVAQQILLPAGFQGTAINIKALQGVKVIPIAQAHGQGKGKIFLYNL
ncbi:hypothetical protein NQ314_000690 [Rhamnusium bicolor]|uniref:Uncharacterized protein n=1 Tax=Rhamnusium bicolor TaxID=1586634 RepID=A0AAV8ZVM6_9CUCU|nr:hypothetical protein NQ314_000690 [Rhamnusium bicolor]